MRTVQTLRIAFTAMQASRPSNAHGMDGVSFSAFRARASTEIALLSAELAEERYQPLPPSPCSLPKRGGGSRTIGIAAVRDRVAQRAFLLVSEPYFEPHFSNHSYGFRPGRNCHQATLAILDGLRRGRTHTAHIDVATCFDTLPHAYILRRFQDHIPSPRMNLLLQRWLRIGAVAIPDLLTAGVVQGFPLSPFLANLVLDCVDKVLDAGEVEYVRYADDITLLGDTRGEVEERVALVSSVLGENLGMALNPKKTRYSTADAGADMLGFRIGGRDTLAMAGDRVDAISERLREVVDAIPERVRRGEDSDACILGIAHQLDGVVAYFGRLGLTPALVRQFECLLTAVAEARAGLPLALRYAAVWARGPGISTWLCRFGALDGTASSRGDVLQGTTYRGDRPVEPGPEAGTLPPALEAELGAGGAELGEAIDQPSGVPSDEATMASETIPKLGEPPTVCAATEAGADADLDVAVVDGRTLHVLRGSVGLSATDTHVRVHLRRRTVVEVPLADLDIILVQSWGVSLSSHTAWRLVAAEVAVVFANPGGDDVGILSGPAGNRPDVRCAQARFGASPAALAAATGMLSAKLGNQAGLLKYLARAPGRKKAGQSKMLATVAEEIRFAAVGLQAAAANMSPGAPANVSALMGHEGGGAAKYWSAVRRIVPEALGFPGRRTRGAVDPVNMALNYAYGILYAEVWRAVARAGLDPGLGLLHTHSRRDGALVCDLVEELRAPLADRLVLTLLGRGWTPTLAGRGAARLSAGDRALLVRAYRRQRKRSIRHGRGTTPIGELAWTQARTLRDVVLGEAGAYTPYRFRW